MTLRQKGCGGGVDPGQYGEEQKRRNEKDLVEGGGARGPL